MDVQEWELLPKEGFSEIHDDGGNKNSSTTLPTSLMSYFIRPQSLKTRVHPIVLEPSSPNLQQHKEAAAAAAAAELPTPSQGIESGLRADEDPVSQVLFTKMKETEFVEAELDSRRGFHFEENEQPCGNSKVDLEMATKRNNSLESSDADRFNIWKWSLIGVAAAAAFCIIGSWTNTNKQNQKHHPQRE